MDQNKLSPLEFELLGALVTRLYNPDTPEQAAKEIEAAIVKLKRFSMLLDNIRWLVLLFGLLIAAIGIISLFADTKTSGIQSTFTLGVLSTGMALALKLFERMKQLARSETNWNAKGSVRRWVGDTHQNGFGHDLSPK